MKYSQLGPVMLDVQGVELTQQEREVLAHPQVGGVILFARNYHDPKQLTHLNRAIRECKPSMLIAVDHEGGRVQRFKSSFTRIPAMHNLAQRSPQLLMPTAQLMALELMACGVDFTFAPVLDRFNPASQVIGDRAFCEDPTHITQYAKQFIAGLAAEGMAAVGKHFPGHGGVEGDTQTDEAIDTRSFEAIEASDLQPFKQLAPCLQGMMPAHVIFPDVCDKPVGFSAQWLQKILRQQLQFSGAIFSDDLSMAAAKVAGAPFDRGLAALQAGCTMALLCNQPDEAIQLIEGLEAVGSSTPTLSSQAQHAREPLLLGLSARQRRSQQSFNWQTLQKTAFWQDTHQALKEFLERS